jgi:hypothetical protein
MNIFYFVEPILPHGVHAIAVSIEVRLIDAGLRLSEATPKFPTVKLKQPHHSFNMAARTLRIGMHLLYPLHTPASQPLDN